MMKYLKYSLLLLEPTRISDDSSAKQGQTTTRRYIPGSAIRGLVVNKLASEDYFDSIKTELFSDHVRFHNAYPSLNVGGEEKLLLPAPKGFYEDKSIVSGEKEVSNVVVGGEYDEVMKRARLGSFVLIEQSDSGKEGSYRRMRFYTPAIESDTKIKLGMGKDQEVFRSTAIRAGYRFTGYIALDHAELSVKSTENNVLSLAQIVESALQQETVLGNARTAGYGKCRFENCVLTEEMPYAPLAIDADSLSGSDEKECYMMLLSDTTMRDEQGEYCGLHLATLESALGVENLRIRYCSTSVTDIRGFNRHYGGAIPSVAMYEKGSVFHFVYQGKIDREHLDAVHRNGVGIRRNEGYGQVLLLDGYEKIRYKIKGTDDLKGSGCAEGIVKDKHAEDQAVIKNVAKTYYMNVIRAAMREYAVNNPLKERSTASQLGNILSIAIRYRFDPEAGWKNIDGYYEHKSQKEQALRVHSAGKNKLSDPIYKNVISVIKTKPLTELLSLQLKGMNHDQIMGISLKELLSDAEIMRIRLELLIQLIRFNLKKEVKE